MYPKHSLGRTSDGAVQRPLSRRTRRPLLAPALAATAFSVACAGLLAACGAQQPTSTPRPRPNHALVVFDGDSLTEGFMLEPHQSYPAQVMRQLPDGTRSVNVAVSGQTWPELLSDVAQEVDPYAEANAERHVVVVWAAANDLAMGYSPQEVLANARTYCLGRRERGFTVLILTMYPLEPPQADADYDRVRRDYNELLRVHWQKFADGLIDVAADPRIGDASGESRSRYFIDMVHLNEAGYGVIADCVIRVLQPLVPPR